MSAGRALWKPIRWRTVATVSREILFGACALLIWQRVGPSCVRCGLLPETSAHRAMALDQDALLARCGVASKRLRLPADTRRARRSSRLRSRVRSRQKRRHLAEGEPWEVAQVD